MNEELTAVRSLDTIAAEIRALTASMLSNVIEIGRRMVEAKDVVPYGQFGDWLRENTGYSTSTANNFMRIFAEYGDPQKSLFGSEPLCQTFGKLSYSKALALLSVPAEERESFAAEVDAEHLSTRELKEAIAAREAAEQALAQADEAIGNITDRLNEAKTALEEERAAAEGTALKLQEAQEQRDAFREKLRAQAEKNEELQKQVKELENRPTEVAVQEPSQEDIDRAVAEAMAETEKAHAAEIEALKSNKQAEVQRADKLAEEKKKLAEQLAEAREKLKSADAGSAEEKKALSAEVERLKKELVMSDSAVTAFRLHFASWQTAYKQMTEELAKVAPETQEKLRAAVSAQMSAWRADNER